MCTRAEERAGIRRIGFGSKRDDRPTEADHSLILSYLIFSRLAPKTEYSD